MIFNYRKNNNNNMEKLLLIALITSLPALIFMLIAKVKDSQVYLANFILRLPSLISFICIVILSLSYFGFIKI